MPIGIDMPLENIKGQEKALQYLKSALKNRKLPHAFIFVGPKGSGRSILARLFAQAVNCQDEEHAPCGRCNSCSKVEKGIHPDVAWIRKDEKSNQIKIQSIRELERGIILRPYEGRYKVFIIPDSESMNPEASNSFLKTLEEPPGHSLIILIAPSANDLLPTIRSRCQIVRLSPLKRSVLKSVLVDEYHMPEKKADFISRYAEGKLGKALSYKDKFAEWKNAALDEFLNEEGAEIYTRENRGELSEKLSILASWYRDLLIYKTTGDTELLIHVDRLGEIERESGLYSTDAITNMLESVIKTKKMLEANVNPKLALSVMYNAVAAQ
jgi:DNA polymerase-3 subunit delta'